MEKNTFVEYYSYYNINHLYRLQITFINYNNKFLLYISMYILEFYSKNHLKIYKEKISKFLYIN